MSDIMSISRLRMGIDGVGITTLIGFYGCPLNCEYCANKHCHNRYTLGADYTAEELIETLSIDEPYFLMTGGGVSFGGGEPLLQANFIYEVCQKMKKNWRRTMETSLYVPWEQVALLVNDIDYWYVDIKEIDAEIYEKYTGKSNTLPLANLKKLVNTVGTKKVCVRLPLIPDYNNEDIRNKGVSYIREHIDPNITIDMFEYIKC